MIHVDFISHIGDHTRLDGLDSCHVIGLRGTHLNIHNNNKNVNNKTNAYTYVHCTLYIDFISILFIFFTAYSDNICDNVGEILHSCGVQCDPTCSDENVIPAICADDNCTDSSLAIPSCVCDGDPYVRHATHKICVPKVDCDQKRTYVLQLEF